MNRIKKTILHSLIKIYNGKYRFLKIRKIIKRLIGKERIQLKYENINLLVGTQSAIENSILFDEYNEKAILNLITYFSTLNYDFIDVGANVGIHSLTAACANKNIQVFSFEPEPNNFYNFILNITANQIKNIMPFRLGVGKTNEFLKLNINDGWNKGRHSLKNNFGDHAQQLIIPIVPIDMLQSCFSKQNNVIKIDVEGFEKEVLEGASIFLQKVAESVIIIEILQENNETQVCTQIVDLIKNYGFLDCYKIEENNCFKKVETFQGSSDYIFIKGEATLAHFSKNISKCE